MIENVQGLILKFCVVIVISLIACSRDRSDLSQYPSMHTEGAHLLVSRVFFEIKEGGDTIWSLFERCGFNRDSNIIGLSRYSRGACNKVDSAVWSYDDSGRVKQLIRYCPDDKIRHDSEYKARSQWSKDCSGPFIECDRRTYVYLRGNSVQVEYSSGDGPIVVRENCGEEYGMSYVLDLNNKSLKLQYEDVAGGQVVKGYELDVIKCELRLDFESEKSSGTLDQLGMLDSDLSFLFKIKRKAKSMRIDQVELDGKLRKRERFMVGYAPVILTRYVDMKSVLDSVAIYHDGKYVVRDDYFFGDKTVSRRFIYSGSRIDTLKVAVADQGRITRREYDVFLYDASLP